LPQVWAERLVWDVAWRNTALDQGAAYLVGRRYYFFCSSEFQNIHVWCQQNDSGKLRYVAPFAPWLDIRVAGTEPYSFMLTTCPLRPSQAIITKPCSRRTKKPIALLFLIFLCSGNLKIRMTTCARSRPRQKVHWALLSASR